MQQKFLRGLPVVALFILLSPAQASTVTIDFEEFLGFGSAPESFTSHGYTFTQLNSPEINGESSTGVLDFAGTNATGTLFFFCPDCNPVEGFTMEATNGLLFSLESLDTGFWQGDSMPITVTGVYADDSTVVASFNNVNGQDWDPLETLTFGSEWSDLASITVEFDNTNNYLFNIAGVDNIVASVVPIPPAILLFSSGLMGLVGWKRHKQKP